MVIPVVYSICFPNRVVHQFFWFFWSFWFYYFKYCCRYGFWFLFNWLIFYPNFFRDKISFFFICFVFPSVLIFENGLFLGNWFTGTNGSHIIAEWQWFNWNCEHCRFTINHFWLHYFNFDESRWWCKWFIN